MNIPCPACGSTEVTKSSNVSSISVPYGVLVKYTEVICTCSTCGTEGDFANENSSAINAALDQSTASAVLSILDYLTKCGITPASFERCLRLPMGTVNQWKDKTPPSALALLCIIRTFPWLLEVADENFDPGVACDKLNIAAQMNSGQEI